MSQFASMTHLLGLCRTSGTVGLHAFEELFRQGEVALCVEVPPLSQADDELLHVPINYPDSILPRKFTPIAINLVGSLPALRRDDHRYLEEFEWGCNQKVSVDHLCVAHVSAQCADVGYFIVNINPTSASLSMEYGREERG